MSYELNYEFITDTYLVLTTPNSSLLIPNHSLFHKIRILIYYLKL